MVVLRVNKSGYHTLYRDNSFCSFHKKSVKNIKEKEFDINESVKKTKSLVKRIIHNQDFGRSSFLTLTFRDERFSDYSLAVYEFTKFIQRLNYYIYNCKEKKIKYLAVPEKQNRGVWHFHIILFSVTYISNDKLSELWGLGFIRINEVKDINHLVNYVCKYINKQLVDNFSKNRKKILTSKGLEKGIKIVASDTEDFYIQCMYNKDNLRLVYSKNISIENFKKEKIFIALYEIYFSKDLYYEIKDYIIQFYGSFSRFVQDDIRRNEIEKQERFLKSIIKEMENDGEK